MHSGTPKGIRFENGTTLNMDDIINENLKEDQHVWVILKGLFYNSFNSRLSNGVNLAQRILRHLDLIIS